MFPRVPTREPPPPYQYPPEYEDIGSQSATSREITTATPPLSPTLSEGEIEAFGHRISRAGTDRLRTPRPLTAREPTAARQSLTPQPTPGRAGRVESASDIPVISHSPPRPNSPVPTASSGDAVTETPDPTPSSSSINSTAFEMLIHVTQPPKKISAGPGRKRKTQKQDPLSYGPVSGTATPTPEGWESFLVHLATQLETTPAHLVLNTLSWRWIRPANSMWLPLRSESGYISMVHQMEAKLTARTPSAPYIIVSMDPPLKPAVSASTNAMPWSLTASVAGPSTSAALDESDDSDVDDRRRKKPRFDDKLEPIIESIDEKYPIGICSIHKEKHCFHHRTSNQHFILERPQKIVWAAKISAGKATLLHPPLGSNLFKSTDAAPVPSAPADAQQPVTPPAAPLPPTVPLGQVPPFPQIPPNPFTHHFPPNPYTYPLQNYYNYPPPLPHPFYAPQTLPQFNPWGMGPQAGTSPSRRSEREDPRSSPPPSGGSIEEFCARYNFDANIVKGLNDLGFSITDDLDEVKETHWERVGFLPLVWARVTKAHKKYKRDLRLDAQSRLA